MSVFSAMDVGRTGVGFSQFWLDTVAHNIANANTITGPDDDPVRARRVVARSLGAEPYAPAGSGVAVGGVRETDAEAPLVHDPTHPFADADGNVRHAAVDLTVEMHDLMVAARSYQVNLRTIESAREAYQSALRIGQR